MRTGFFSRTRIGLRAAVLVLLIFGLPGTGQARTETFRWLDPNPDPSPVVAFRLHLGPSHLNYTTMIDFGLPSPDVNGIYSASAEVADDATVYVAMTSRDVVGEVSLFSNEKVLLALAGQPPQSSIVLPTGPVTITVGDSVIFAGSGSDPDGDLPLTYSWGFGASGLSPSSAQNPGALTFSQVGSFDVTLTVTDSGGDSDPTPASVSIEVAPPAPPPNGHIDDPTGDVTITAGETVNFAGSVDGGVPPFFYEWVFGSSGILPSDLEDPGPIAFTKPGVYTVRLTVMDDRGLVDSTPATVVVTVGQAEAPPGAGSTGNGSFVPASTSVEVDRVATGLDSPVYLTAPLGDPRLFVVESGGLIRIVDDGTVLSVPFLDLSSDVSDAPEGGLLGLAFDPGYAQNGTFYVYRTDAGGVSVLSRFRVSDDPDVADATSEEVILSVDQPFDGQNGGSIAFGPVDGFLYLGLGDGGSTNDPDNLAQDGGELLGKLLRLDVGQPNGAYAIPADNPFVSNPFVRNEIWAFGLRNPYRFSFDRDLFDLWLTDEGQDAREEINFELRGDAGGHNYGWDVMEGGTCNENDPASSPPCGDASLMPPIHDYPHTDGKCAITGGYVYRGTAPGLWGHYFFADYCSGGVWSIDRISGEGVSWTQALGNAAGDPFQIVSFGEGGGGNLYILHADGDIYRIGAVNPECGDGLDNDGDGFIDVGSDPGCRTASTESEDPKCDDGLDNDGDELVDARDPECEVPWWDMEDKSPEEVLGASVSSGGGGGSCGIGFELAFVLPPLMWLRRRRRRS